MNSEKMLAGAFAGAGGLLSIYLGVTTSTMELTVGGLLLINTLMAFFVGEKNGQRQSSKDKD